MLRSAAPSPPPPCDATCPLCDAAGEVIATFAQSVTSEAKVVAHPSTLFLCPVCGHLFTRLAIDVDAYYAASYDATLTDEGQDELVVTATGETRFRTEVDYALFRKMTGARLGPSSSVFEYGCGRGRILSRLVKDGVTDVYAHDVGEGYREPVLAIVGPGRVTIGARPPPRQVDVACSFFVLEHDPRPRDALAFLRAHLGKDGLLYVVVPAYTSNLGDLACADHVNHFSPASLSALVESCGFDVLAVDATSAIGSVALLARPGLFCPRVGSALPEARRAATELVGYVARLADVTRSVPSSTPVYVYGAGFYGAMTVAGLRATGRDAAGFFDANPRKQGLLRLGLPVSLPPTVPLRAHASSTLIVSVNGRLAPEIVARFKPVFGTVVAP